MTETYTWIPESWGDCDATEAESAAACERAEEWLTEHEGDAISINVRPPREGEAPGIYDTTAHVYDTMATTPRMQILGYTIPCPEVVRELTDGAWQHALETWPAD